MAKQSICIDVDLGIECDDAALACDDERIDFDQARILVDVQPVQRLRESRELFELRTGESEAECEPPALKALQSRGRMNVDGDDLLRRMSGDLLDVHPACRRGDEGYPAAFAVEHEAQIYLTRDLRARLDVDLIDRHAFRAGLSGNEMTTEHCSRC